MVKAKFYGQLILFGFKQSTLNLIEISHTTTISEYRREVGGMCFVFM